MPPALEIQEPHPHKPRMGHPKILHSRTRILQIRNGAAGDSFTTFLHYLKAQSRNPHQAFTAAPHEIQGGGRIPVVFQGARGSATSHGCFFASHTGSGTHNPASGSHTIGKVQRIIREFRPAQGSCVYGVRLLVAAGNDRAYHGFNLGGHLLSGDAVGGLKPAARGPEDGPGRRGCQQCRIGAGCQRMT